MNNKEIANQWFEAFNQHNLENLLELYHENAEHFSPKLKAKYPETNGLITGKNKLRAWWAESFKNIPTLQYSPNFIIAENNLVFMEYIRKVNNEPSTTIAELLVIENGTIVKSKVY